ncbi:MAG: hypothetical protein WCQ95_07535 [Bacteroidota bacterium]
MKQTMIVAIWLASLLGFGQTKPTDTNKPITTKYAGRYSYGNNIDKGRVGVMYVYAETDSSILFYLELNRGAPSYSMGSIYNSVKIKNDTGTFYTKFAYATDGCKWIFRFSKNRLTLATVNSAYDCDFGHGVFADGDFKRTSNIPPDSFIDLEGKTIHFATTKPQEYNKSE